MINIRGEVTTMNEFLYNLHFFLRCLAPHSWRA